MSVQCSEATCDTVAMQIQVRYAVILALKCGKLDKGHAYTEYLYYRKIS
jgi:hypothetical protein